MHIDRLRRLVFRNHLHRADDVACLMFAMPLGSNRVIPLKSRMQRCLLRSRLINDKRSSQLPFLDIDPSKLITCLICCDALDVSAVGTAVAPGIGTLLFGALGAGLGGGGGSLAEEAIEGLSGVSDQTAKEIAKDAGKEALIAGGAELLFGAPFLLFRSLAPKAGILKEGDSEAVETVKKAVDMEFAPSGRQLGVSPIRAKAESLVESVIGTSPRLRANRIAMNKQVDNYKTKLAEYATKSGGKYAGEVFVNLSNKSKSSS